MLNREIQRNWSWSNESLTQYVLTLCTLPSSLSIRINLLSGLFYHLLFKI
jgi:hypothetical protein